MRTMIVILLVAVFSAYSQSSANFDLSENVVASGGGTSSGPTFRLIGSIGQPLAGTTSLSANFRLTGGFEAIPPIAPIEIPVQVSGKVQTPIGRGVAGASVVLTDPATGQRRSVTTNTFGSFRITGVPAGRSYVISVTHRRYQIADSTRFLEVFDNVIDILFTAVRE